MGLIGINPGRGRGSERKPSTLENIAAAVDIASKVLGTGLETYKTFGPEKTLNEANVKETEARAKYYDAKSAEKPETQLGSLDKIHVEGFSKDNNLVSEGDKRPGAFQTILPESQKALTWAPRDSKVDKKEAFGQEDSLRKEFNDKIKKFVSTRGAVQSAASVLQKPEDKVTYADDLAIVYSFITAQDPGSRVTGGEIQTSTEASPILKQLAQKYNEAKNNQKFIFDKDTRRDFIRTMFDQYGAAKKDYDIDYSTYQQIAKSRGLKFDVPKLSDINVPEMAAIKEGVKQSVVPGAPPVGTVDQGMKFMGGNHRDPSNWVPVE
jgi:ribosomal protein L20